MLTVDSWGKITDANQKILDLVGKRKDNLIGVDFQDILKKGIAFAPGKQFDLRFNSLSLPCRVVRQKNNNILWNRQINPFIYHKYHRYHK